MVDESWRDVLVAARATLKDQAGFLHSFAATDPATKRTVIARNGDHQFNRNDKTDQSTSTAFCISRLARAGVDPLTSEEASPIAADDWATILATAEADFLRNSETVLAAPTSATEAGKETGGLPNTYNSAIHLAAAARLINADQAKRPDEVVRAGDELAKQFVVWLGGSGYVKTLKPETSTRKGVADVLEEIIFGDANAYLTYLVVDALVDWHGARVEAQLRAKPGEAANAFAIRNSVEKALKLAFDAALVAICRMLAAHSAKSPSMFDALDLVSTTSTILRAGVINGSIDRFTTATVDAAVQLLLGEYLISDGSFAPKAPAFAVTGKDSGPNSVTVSSAEIAEVLLSSFEAWDIKTLESIAPALSSITARAKGGRSWGKDTAPSKRRHVFAAVSSWCALTQFDRHTATARAADASTALRVPASAPAYGFDPPDDIKARVDRRTIEPILRSRRDLASMSMVLFGPPGTAKTTLAEYIAWRLRWPLLEVTPATFLTAGIAGLEVEVGRTFSLLPDLRDTVVLFDEFEGILGDRSAKGTGIKPSDAARFLTTSMLPRLHDLRDRGQIVFLIATNHAEDLDDAAIRPGRVDDMIEVKPPPIEAKRIAVARALETMPEYNGTVPKSVKTWLKNEYVRNDRLTYGYLKQMVREAVLLGESATTDILADFSKEQVKRLTSEQGTAEGDK